MEYWKARKIIPQLIDEEAKRRYPNNIELQSAFKEGGLYVGNNDFDSKVCALVREQEEEEFKKEYSQYTKQELIEWRERVEERYKYSNRETTWCLCEAAIDAINKAIRKGYYKQE